MTDWQMWLTLGGMLCVGGFFNVGCFLAQFAAAAFLTSGAARARIFLGLDEQVRFFLLCSLVLMLLTVAWRKRHFGVEVKQGPFR